MFMFNLKVFRNIIVVSLNYKEVRIFFDLVTALNIFVLCLQGYIDFQLLLLANNIFSLLLLVEIIMKIISQGLSNINLYSKNDILKMQLIFLSFL